MTKFKNNNEIETDPERDDFDCGKASRQLFIFVYNSYRHIGFEMAVTMTKSRQISEDIMHDVFLKIWAQKNALCEIKDFAAYIRALVRNQVIDYSRKQKNDRLVRKNLCYHKELVIDLSDEIISREIHRLLQLAIQSLSPQRKKVFVLGWLEGWNRKQVAEQLNISENTVRNLMQEARRDIREFMMKKEICLTRKSVLKKLARVWPEEQKLKVA